MAVVLIIVSYLLGSVSTAYFVSRMYGVDLKEEGTKNPGATNVYKVIGPGWGLLTALFDLFKGFVPTFIAKELLQYNMLLVTGVALGAIIGHNWPVFNNFEGGRGLATTLGTMVVINFPLGFIVFVVGLFLTIILRKKLIKNLRIWAIVYPLFTIFILYPVFNIYKLIYGIGITSIAGLRAWQLRQK